MIIMEIKPTELRIGNLILQPNGEVCKVTYNNIRYLIISITPTGYKPIPITEDWLLKLGYEIKIKKVRRDNKIHIVNFMNMYIYEGKIKLWLSEYFFSGLYKTKSIQYVHELQNLHFALTGEEL
jgi:hypothetical protein